MVAFVQKILHWGNLLPADTTATPQSPYFYFWRLLSKPDSGVLSFDGADMAQWEHQ